MSLISKPICLLISPYLKKENKPTIKKKNTDMQKHLISKSDQHLKIFEVTEQAVEIPPIRCRAALASSAPRPWTPDFAAGPFYAAMTPRGWKPQPRSQQLLFLTSCYLLSLKRTQFPVSAALLTKGEHPQNLHLCKTSPRRVFRLPNRLLGHRVVREINCERFLLFKWQRQEEA